VSCIVRPEQIENELLRLWETLAKENKTKASLFNLVVFNRYSPRTDYIRSIVQKVVEKFPCRVLFISEDVDAKAPFLKTAISVLMPQGAESTVGCEQIDIGAAGADIEKVPSLILSHLLPDLPITLFWAEDPSKSHPLFDSLSRLAHRIIFDSECADDLKAYAKSILELHEVKKKDVADLNWARTEGWRELLVSIFNSEERLQELRDLSLMEISYNERPTEFFCHLKIQSLYLQAWFISRLNMKFKSSITHQFWEKLGPGTIISVRLKEKNGQEFTCERLKDRYHSVLIQIASPEICQLPYEFMLGQTATGQSLVQEICRRGTSEHYLRMLKQLT
jgi:glucose-6-phosphate dehydrogenase assembly protein OpcA